MASAPSALDNLDRLRHDLRGTLTLPTDPGYDAARAIAYAAANLRPAAIARVADAVDVARAIAFARETGTELAVRSGGHSGAGHGSTDGGIVIDLRDLTSLDVDPSARTAWAGTGLTAGAVTKALAEHDLAIGFGDTASVGIGGITLGGGVGYLVRKHGLTIDNLIAAEIVTADGEQLHVDAESHPDLFWAIRGGGGNFGVATRFQYRLHPLAQIVGGMLLLPATPETVAGFLRLSDTAPEELSTIANVMNCPPMPFVPEQHHGSLVIMGMLCWAGDPADGTRIIDGFRALAEPIADLVQTGPYPSLYQEDEPPATGPSDEPQTQPSAVARTMFLDRVGMDEATLIVRRLTESDAPMRVVQLRVLGGAAARVPADATAYAHRSSRIMANVAAFYVGDEDGRRRQAWVEDVCRGLQQEDRGAYVNFISDEGPDRVRAAYPDDTWRRLLEVKHRYDPTNLFRRNQNIAEAPTP